MAGYYAPHSSAGEEIDAMLERPYKLRGDLRFFQDNGGDPNIILEPLKLPIEAVNSLAPIAVDRIAHAYQRLDGVGGAKLAFCCGQAVRPQYLGVLGFHLMNSPTVGDLLAQWSRYSLAIGYPLQSRFVIDRAEWRLEFRPRYVMGEGALRWCMLSTLAGTMPSLRLLSGHDLNAVKLALPFPRNECGALSDLLGVAFSYGQSCGHVTGRLADLDCVLLPADPDLKAVTENYCRQLLHDVTSESRMADQVRQRLFQSPVAPSLNEMAALLQCSQRTLQRQLKAEGQTYREILDAFRREKAFQALGQGVGLKHLSHMLGFSDLRAFRRSFRQWTGVSPSQWRCGKRRLN